MSDLDADDPRLYKYTSSSPAWLFSARESSFKGMSKRHEQLPDEVNEHSALSKLKIMLGRVGNTVIKSQIAWSYIDFETQHPLFPQDNMAE
jgi:hypothetical protein